MSVVQITYEIAPWKEGPVTLIVAAGEVARIRRRVRLEHLDGGGDETDWRFDVVPIGGETERLAGRLAVLAKTLDESESMQLVCADQCADGMVSQMILDIERAAQLLSSFLAVGEQQYEAGYADGEDSAYADYRRAVTDIAGMPDDFDALPISVARLIAQLRGSSGRKATP